MTSNDSRPASSRAAPWAALLVAALAGGGVSCSSRAPAAAPGADAYSIALIGRHEFEAPEPTDPTLLPEELSGIVWIGGDQYLAIGDAHACVHRLAVRLDKSGRVVSAAFGEPIVLRDEHGVPLSDAAVGEDREGIAYGPDTATVWISNERDGRDPNRSSIACHHLPDGRLLRFVEVGRDSSLACFAAQRRNRGLESLSLAPVRSVFWTANEAPLQIDGPEATDSTGGVVRLLQLDPSMSPVAQFAYEIDPYTARIAAPFFLSGNETSGVSDLAALEDGRLLVLERAFAGDSTGTAGLRSRIYLVETDGATDVSRGDLANGLAGRSFVPARKTLLWQVDSGFTNSNFEGMTLGPALDGGDRVILLVADNTEGGSQALLTLRLHVPSGG
jgi:hypothetical protein